MRQSTWLAAMMGILAVAAPALGQVMQGQATILQNEVEVRSGPSTQFYPTSKLQRNERVFVLRESKEAPGWLEIMPPTGSFSWISGKSVRFAKEGDRLGFVDADPTRPVSILPGSTLVNQAPNRESMKLTTGTIVVVIDRPLSINGETWLPIQPHPSEVRYIPKDSVNPTPVVATNNAPPNWNRTPDGMAANADLARAEQALQAGDINGARQLFQLVANNSTDQNAKYLAMNKLATLSQSQFTPTSGQKPDLTRSGFTPGAPTVVGNLQQLQAATWTTYGRLRDTRMTREDGQPIYSLEDNQGRVLTYITTNPGKSLQSYIGRTVAVYGPTMWRPDSAVRLQYVVASHVAVP